MKYIVDEAFVKNAEACAKGVEELRAAQEKTAAAKEDLTGLATMVAETLVQQGIIDGHSKAAAVARLIDPKEALQAISMVAQKYGEKVKEANVSVPKLGKQAGTVVAKPESSDEVLFRGLGLRK